MPARPGAHRHRRGRARSEHRLPARLSAAKADLAYELTEPYQPKVDREVRAFIRSQAFTPRDFVIDAKGVCRVHPELAQALVSVLGGLMARETTRESALVFFSARSRP